MIERPIDRILASLSDVKLTGNGWIARCPAHDDRTPSLSVAEGDDHRILIRCHAGCTADAICSAMGISTGDLFPKASAPAPRAQQSLRASRSRRLYATRDDAIRAAARGANGSIVAGWNYTAADSSDLFWIVRLETTDGKQYRPITREGNRWGIADPPGPLPLYRLPHLAGATRVYVTEGEKAADALVEIALNATTSAHGAGSAKRSDWTPLAGIEVVIVPDRDPAGEKYASEVAELLSRLEPPPVVRILRLSNLPTHGDAVEHIAARRADGLDNDAIRAEIEKLADSAEVVQGPGPRARIVRLADVAPTKLEFLWPGRLPLGKLTLLAGDPNLGKSLVTLDLAARVSTGTPWPDRRDQPNPPGGVVLLSAEDDVADTIRPRLDVARADVTKIVALQGVEYRNAETGRRGIRAFNLEFDLPELEHAIRQTADCRLIVIDPISSYLGRTDSHRNAEVRGVLAPLAELAARHRVAMLAVTHLTKNYGGKAMYRPTGSLAFMAAARAAWLVVKDPKEHGRRLLLPVKANLTRDPTGLAYSVESRTLPGIGEIGVVAWEDGIVELSADDAIAIELDQGRGAATALDEAAEWLREVLSHGPVEVRRVEADAKACGLSVRTIRRAKREIGAIARKESFGGGWSWALPAEGGQGAEEKSLAAFGQNERLGGCKDAYEDGQEREDGQAKPLAVKGDVGRLGDREVVEL